MVYRIYVEKKAGFTHEADALRYEIRHILSIKNLESVRIINRYDAQGLDKELFDYCVGTVFSEPQVDCTFYALPEDDALTFGVEFLPGQFDQRADSASQCIALISCGVRPKVASAKIYKLYGNLTKDEIEAVKKYVINPVEAREASLELPTTLEIPYEIPSEVEVLEGFNSRSHSELEKFIEKYALAMDIDDIEFCQSYFKSEGKEPTITEIRMIDTYWSDHCRHTTFLTEIDRVTFTDKLLQDAYDDYIKTRAELGRTKPICLMDIGTLAAKYLKKTGRLTKLDESEEINACTVNMQVEVDGKCEDWLLLFKNETHNHPTEIEPFGGAATCIGGAIRDPLSGRSYVYGAMRVTGAADPTKKVSETIPGKLSQRKIVTTAANGYSSYGNQIGLATGIVDEIYHDGYVAKRMEIGAVIAATPKENVRRECPAPGDIVILLGGRTGRDGCGGATGSSKSHTLASLETCGAEVQKGNAPEERKLQRLFRSKEACLMIKRCNDFGAGGVSVAIGELADGLDINLNAIPKKYDGLDGTELAISESQERMAVVVEKENVDKFIALADRENLEATVVAKVKAEPRLTMTWNGKIIVDVSREFLNSNGASKHIEIETDKSEDYSKKIKESFTEEYKRLASDLNVCSKKGLSERFDSTIGANTVLMPFGGSRQMTPIQAMVQTIAVEKKHTDTVSLMSYGYNPFITEISPYHGAYLAVVESAAKLIATGASYEDVYLTFQEYFKRPSKDPKRWGQPLAALLGAFEAQKNLGIAAIGGKDSMSGSFENIDVPPTLVSFAVTTDKAENIITNHFKKSGNRVYLLKPKYDSNNLPETKSLISLFNRVTKLCRGGKIISAYTPTYGGVAEAIMKMSFGEGFGFEYSDCLNLSDIFGYAYGSFVVEATDEIDGAIPLGIITDKDFTYKGEAVDCDEILSLYENKLENVYHCNIEQNGKIENVLSDNTINRVAPCVKCAKPKVLIPVFPGTNCEYDSAKAVADAGAEPDIYVINNLTADGITRSVSEFASRIKSSQIIFIPGGFSGGDEPDGSGKFITAFFRNAEIKEGVTELLERRDGLMCGICNGFQALLKLGLVPFGKIIDTDENCPTLTFNTIARHQSKIVRTRIVSNKSPWLSFMETGDIISVPISHGEGRFTANEATLCEMINNNQIATQYVDENGNAAADIRYNPNNSVLAIEGITSPDGRVFGKMGHSERVGKNLYKNVPGNYDIRMFEGAVKYFK